MAWSDAARAAALEAPINKKHAELKKRFSRHQVTYSDVSPAEALRSLNSRKGLAAKIKKLRKTGTSNMYMTSNLLSEAVSTTLFRNYHRKKK